MSAVQSIDRVLNLLELIAKHDKGITLSELCEKIGLHKSTVHRLVGSLIDNGYVYQTEDLKYLITYKLYELGVRTFVNISILDAARESLVNLSNQVGEVVHLVVRNMNEIIYIDKENSGRNSSIMGSSIGSSAPMYCTSVGKAMLFDASDYELENIWNTSIIVKKTDKTIVNLELFKKELAESKKKGYAIDDEENELGIRCFGAPIYNYRNNIIAAISLSGPISRLSKEDGEKYYIPLLKAAKEISQKMGYLNK